MCPQIFARIKEKSCSVAGWLLVQFPGRMQDVTSAGVSKRPHDSLTCTVDRHGRWQCVFHVRGVTGRLLWSWNDWVLDADRGQSEERGNIWGSVTGAEPSNHFHTRLRVTQQGKTATTSLGVKRPELLIFDPASQALTHTIRQREYSRMHDRRLTCSGKNCLKK